VALQLWARKKPAESSSAFWVEVVNLDLTTENRR